MHGWITIASGVATMIGGAALYWLPLLFFQIAAFVVVSIGFVMTVVGVWQVWESEVEESSGPVPDSWHWNWRVDSRADDIWPVSRLVSLPKAAKIAYDQLQGSLAADMASKMDYPLSYIAIALSDKGKTPLFGTRPPSTVLQRVPPEECKKSSFIEDGRVLQRYGRGKPLYDNVCIKRSDLKRMIKQLRDW